MTQKITVTITFDNVESANRIINEVDNALFNADVDDNLEWEYEGDGVE